jgi:hypothetical protein
VKVYLVGLKVIAAEVPEVRLGAFEPRDIFDATRLKFGMRGLFSWKDACFALRILRRTGIDAVGRIPSLDGGVSSAVSRERSPEAFWASLSIGSAAEFGWLDYVPQFRDLIRCLRFFAGGRVCWSSVPQSCEVELPGGSGALDHWFVL